VCLNKLNDRVTLKLKKKYMILFPSQPLTPIPPFPHPSFREMTILNTYRTRRGRKDFVQGPIICAYGHCQVNNLQISAIIFFTRENDLV